MGRVPISGEHAQRPCGMLGLGGEQSRISCGTVEVPSGALAPQNSIRTSQLRPAPTELRLDQPRISLRETTKVTTAMAILTHVIQCYNDKDPMDNMKHALAEYD